MISSSYISHKDFLNIVHDFILTNNSNLKGVISKGKKIKQILK